jgi:Ser/Thr protein kinase RdoA (MazF antagonist)
MADHDRVLSVYPPDCQTTQVEFLRSAGGMSGAQFWRITAPRGQLILRRWPLESPTPDGLRFIHAVLQHAAIRGLAIVPIPVTTASGGSFVEHAGHLWQLDPWMSGTADYRDAPSIEKLTAGMRALAAFHIAVSNFARMLTGESEEHSNAVQRHLARLRELQSPAQIAKLASSISNQIQPQLAQLAQEFVSQVPQLVPRDIAELAPLATAQLPLQPCIRDIWHDHILYTGDRVTGIIDFGAVAIDTPATDIARLLGSLTESPLPNREGQWEGSIADSTSDAWQLGMNAYRTIRPLTDDELRAAHALKTSGTILAGCNWIRWLYIDRRKFENPAQIIERFRTIAAAAGNRIREGEAPAEPSIATR